MRGPDDGEVTVVEGSELRLAEALGQGNQARVNDTQPKVGVIGLKGATALEVRDRGRLGAIGAVQQVVQKYKPDVETQPLVTPVVELGQDQTGNDKVFSRRFEQRGTRIVVWIRRIECCEQGAGVENQRQAL